MSNIYLKVTIENKVTCFDFLGLERSWPDHFWRAPTHADILEFPIFLLQLKNQRSGNRTVCVFSIILILRKIMTF